MTNLKFEKIPFLATLVIFICSLIIIFSPLRPQITSVTPALKTDQEWLTYKNDEFGFLLEYPTTLFSSPTKNDSTIIFGSKNDYTSLEFLDFAVQKISYEKYQQTHSRKLDGGDATTLLSKQWIQDDQIYTLYFGGHNEDVITKNKKDLNRIISSFKILPIEVKAQTYRDENYGYEYVFPIKNLKEQKDGILFYANPEFSFSFSNSKYNFPGSSTQCNVSEKHSSITLENQAFDKYEYLIAPSGDNMCSGFNYKKVIVWLIPKSPNLEFAGYYTYFLEDKVEAERYASQILSTFKITGTQPVIISSPDFTQPVGKPLVIKGKIDRSWVFENSFPIKILDDKGRRVFYGIIQTVNWTNGTSPMIDFTMDLDFNTNSKTGTLVISNDNPSGLPENSKSIEFPLIFH